MESVHEKNSEVFKALCDPKRLAILQLLRSGEKCACVLMEQLGMGQSAVSYHMGILCRSGIVRGRQEGKWVHYSINRIQWEGLLVRLAAIASGSENGLSCECIGREAV